MDILKKMQIEMAVKEDRGMLPEFIQVTKLYSEKMKIYYDELITAGFSKKQAFEMVKDHGIDIGRQSWVDRDTQDGGDPSGN